MEIYTFIPRVSTEPDFCLATLRQAALDSLYAPYSQNFAIASIKELRPMSNRHLGGSESFGRKQSAH